MYLNVAMDIMHFHFTNAVVAVDSAETMTDEGDQTQAAG